MPGSPIASAWVEIVPSAKGFQKSLTDQFDGAGVAAGREGGKRASEGILGGLKGLAAPIAGVFATMGIGKIIGDSIGSAANLEQSIGAIDSVFKQSAGQMHDWAKGAATAVGLTQNEYNELGTLIGTQLKNGGTAIDQLGSKTNDLIGVGADLSSMFGGTTKDAVDALSSALKGERDPIERYGVSLNQAAVDAKAAELGFTKVGGALSAEANQAATLAIIMAQTSDAHGNFAAEADTLSHKQQVLNAMWADGKAAIGSALLPGVSLAAGAFIGILGPALTGAVSGLTFVTDAVGTVYNAFNRNPPTTAMGAWTEPLTTFGGKLAEVSSSVGTFIDSIDFSAIGATLTPLAGSALDLWQAFSPLSLVFAALGPQIPDLASSLGDLAATIGSSISEAVATLVPAITPLVSVLAEGLSGALTTLLPMVTGLATFLRDNIEPVLGLGAAIAGGVLAFKAYQGVLALAKTATIAYAFVQAGLNLIMAANPISIIVIALGALVAGIIYVATQTTFFQDVWTNLTSFLSDAWTNIQNVATTIFTAIGNFFSDTWNNISNFVTDAVNTLINVFLNWTPLGIIIKNFDPILGFFTGLWSNISGFFTDGVSNIVKTFTTLPDKVLGIIGDLGSRVFDAGQAVIQNLIDGIGSMIGAVGDVVGNVMDTIADFFPHSPAKRGVFSGRGWPAVSESGAAVMEQFTAGLTANEPTVFDSSSSSLANAMTSGVYIPNNARLTGGATFTGGSGSDVSVVEITNKTGVRLEELIGVVVKKVSRDEALEARAMSSVPGVSG